MRLGSAKAANKVCSLSLWERVGVRGYGLSKELRPLTRIRYRDPTSPRRGEVNRPLAVVIQPKSSGFKKQEREQK